MFFSILLFACGNSQSQSGNAEATKDEEPKSEVNKIEKFYPDGALKIVGMKRGDKRIGEWESYYANGYKWSEVNYLNGYRSGPTVTYYQNGMMRYEGAYSNGNRSGLWLFYDTTGVLLERIDMDKSVSHSDSLLNENELREN